MNNFLSRILPTLDRSADLQPASIYFSLGLGGKYPIQRPCTHIDHIIQDCTEHSAAGLNAYMALASFSAADKKRSKASAVAAKSIWADIDVGKADSKYTTQREALADLQRFIAETQLPPGVIVSSGKGLHVYWPFTRNVKASAWVQVANGFHRLCQKHGLDVDAHRAEDLASVLRLPGTIHQSSGHEVRVLMDIGPDYDPQDFALRLFRMVPLEPAAPVPVQAQVPAGMPTLAELTGMGPQAPTADAEKIARNCPQVLSMGIGLYPQWFTCMSVLRRCVNGREWAHKLSALDKHGRYDPANTDKFFDMARPDGPARCETLEKLNPQYCAACQYRGRVTSPVQLDRMVPEPAPEPEPVPEGGPLDLNQCKTYPYVKLNDPRFFVDNRGIGMLKPVKNSSGEWETETHIICASQLYFKYGEYIQGDKRPKRSYVFDVIHPNNKVETVRFVIDEDMSKAGIMRWFNNCRMFSTNPAAYGEKVFMEFMNAYLQSVVHSAPELKSYEKFGWDEDLGFVTGDGLITATGMEQAALAPKVRTAFGEANSHKGTLENWKFAPQMYKTLNQPLGQFAVCMAFAAPLMSFSPGEAKNCLLSIWSAKSGKGKSRILSTAASVWGHPTQQFFSKSESSVARQRRLAMLHNIPAFMDELTDMAEEDKARNVFIFLDGKEKNKLKSSGGEFVGTGTWNTCILTTANKPYRAALTEQFGETDARHLRIMEMECTFQDFDDQPTVRAYINQCNQMMEKNYGWAGPEFIYKLLQNPERLVHLQSSIENWVIKRGFKADERYRAYPIAITLQAGRWAVEYGLLDYDMDALEQWAMTTFLETNRKETSDARITSRNTMLRYLSERSHNMLVVHSTKRPKDIKDPGVPHLPDGYVILRSIKEPLLRFEHKDSRLVISRSDFVKWCKYNGYTPNIILNGLKVEGIAYSSSTRSLTDGISWMPMPSIPVIVFEPNALHTLGYKPPEGV